MAEFDLDTFLTKATPNLDFAAEPLAGLSAEMKVQIALVRQNETMIEQQRALVAAATGRTHLQRPHDPIGTYNQSARHAA